MSRRSLSGSSAENPWCIDENGKLILQNALRDKETAIRQLRGIRAIRARMRELSHTAGGPPQRPRINSEPPSSIRQDTIQDLAARQHARGHQDATFVALCAQVHAQASAAADSAPRPRIILGPASSIRLDTDNEPPRRRVRVLKDGKRTLRLRPLTAEDLYLDDARPLTDAEIDVKAYHKCSICRALLTHLVSTQCGHTFCFVCLRVWLEKKWTCLDCVCILACTPHRHWITEEALREAYPTWIDKSRISFSWDGLVFPTEL
ncbi:hypothetical protein C8R45DRAFT_1009965 [Mycena sanguinolenta]|nr:hypothetical protein C8R45DRAFT_1009965 [Mycena sanguinolenta]